MGLKTYRPTTPTLRWQAISDFAELEPKGKRPEKRLTEAVRRSGGRNSQGRLTSRRRGGGHRRRYRIIDFKRDKVGVGGTVLSVEYDPNRSSRIALVEYDDKERRYILAPQGLKAKDRVQAGPGIEPVTGNALPLGEIPSGTFVHNVELIRGRGGQMARSAGSYAIIMGRDGDYVHLKLPSGEVRLVRADCTATVGQVGNVDHENRSWGKAGRSRWLGWRPASRAVAKNPVDHPMGGGEGKSSGGRHPCSRSGQFAKGLRTRRRSKITNRYIVTRRP
jgi:large subunit ribosomal protein L2